MIKNLIKEGYFVVM